MFGADFGLKSSVGFWSSLAWILLGIVGLLVTALVAIVLQFCQHNHHTQPPEPIEMREIKVCKVVSADIHFQYRDKWWTNKAYTRKLINRKEKRQNLGGVWKWHLEFQLVIVWFTYIGREVWLHCHEHETSAKWTRHRCMASLLHSCNICTTSIKILIMILFNKKTI